MVDSLFIRLGQQPEQQVSWLRKGQAISATRHGGINTAAAAAVGSRVVVLAPASEMFCNAVDLPEMSAARLRQALPYALEEQLAADVETMHFAMGKRNPDGRLPVVAVERDAMLSWHTLLQQADLPPHHLLNEAQMLPLREGWWSLLLEDDQVLLHRSDYDAQALPLTQLDAWLELAWDEARAGQAVEGLIVYDARSQPGELPFTVPSDLQLEHQPCTDPLALMAKGSAINLLCGEFSRREQLGRLWRPWRAAGAILLAWLLLQTGIAIANYYSLAAEDRRLHQAIVDLYRETFPDAVNIVNPRVQMERHLTTLRGGGSQSDFIALLADSGPLIAAADNMQLRNMRYRQGELELELELGAIAALDNLKQKLEQAGLQIEIRNATTRDNRVEARLAIRRDRS